MPEPRPIPPTQHLWYRFAESVPHNRDVKLTSQCGPLTGVKTSGWSRLWQAFSVNRQFLEKCPDNLRSLRVHTTIEPMQENIPHSTNEQQIHESFVNSGDSMPGKVGVRQRL